MLKYIQSSVVEKEKIDSMKNKDKGLLDSAVLTLVPPKSANVFLTCAFALLTPILQKNL